jgi:DNA-binding transcriptional regulator YiaG
MAKYTPEERDALAAAGNRLGLGKRDKKIADLRNRATRTIPEKGQQGTTPPKRQRRHKETESESVDRRIEQYKLKPLPKAEQIPTYDVTKPTRYPEVVMWNTAGSLMLDKILKRHAHVMKPQGITPADFKMWREQFMLMNPEQLGALVRVTGRTIRDWENGVSKIPFAMWWVMHVTMQDPEYFLTRPGFHDFYIEYVDGTAHLCSHTYPDIRWTATDLYFNRCALNEVLCLREEIKRHTENFQELTAENTRLRQMLKADGVTSELQAMHDHIGALMKRIHTADVMPLEPRPEAAPEASAMHKAA